MARTTACDNRPRSPVAKITQVRTQLVALFDDKKTTESVPYLTGPKLPAADKRSLPKKDAAEVIDAVVQAIRQRQTEGSTVGLVAKLDADDIEEATRLAEEDADRFDKNCEPLNDRITEFRGLFAELAAVGRSLRKYVDRTEDRSPLAQAATLLDGLNNSFTVAALSFEARRYRQEAALNRRAAEMYEVRVRRSGLSSERHRDRSLKFFYCMLMAQVGVTVSSLALAGTKRSLLWFVAALAGIAALGFSGYVYLSF